MQNEECRMRNDKGRLICFALKEEAAPFRKITAGKSDIAILLTGIGRQNAEKSVREFLGSGASVLASRPQDASSSKERLVSSLAPPGLVLTCGFAGGLNPDLEPGDALFELLNRKNELHESPSKSEVRDSQSSSLRERLVAAGAKPAKFFCADRIATTVAEKKKLRDETSADAVEMESAAIHAVCRERGIPCITVRVISDPANEDLPLDFNQLSKPDKRLDYGKLFWAIAKSPGKTAALMKLQKQTQFAAERLATVLARILWQPT